MKLKLYNTLTRKKEIFNSLKDKKVGLYTCGPTVYMYAHIGNLRTYIFEDILKRTLEYNGYKVKHVMNITDVGHLTSDSDSGEDKLEKSAAKEKKTVWDIANFYTKAFKKDLKRLNIIEPDVWEKATETIEDQINLIKTLEKKGFTYKIKDGIYFDSSKLPSYGRLWAKKIDPKAGARIKMSEKKNPTDFALWKFSPKDKKRQMDWDSPWGVGFPGWHTECVAIGIKNLGIPFDIHCGGIDHIQIHHTNEIAQAEAAYEKSLANYWLHGEFLVLKKARMGKSEGNILTLEELIKKGFHPLSFRYLVLTAHYKSKLVFSLESLESADRALKKLYQRTVELKDSKGKSSDNDYKREFLKYINDDLNTPQALALTWEMLESNLPAKTKYGLLLDFDKIFGLKLKEIKREEIPEEIIELVEEREKCRKKKKFQKADQIRKEIEKSGWQIEDTDQGPKIKKLEVI